MDKAIIVSHNPFAKESYFYIIEDGKMNKYPVASDIDGVVDNVLALTYSNDIYEVRIQGPLYFANEVQKDVQEREFNLYSNNKINIEVM